MVYEELAKVLQDIGKAYEIIFVDDGSVDETLQVLKGVRQMDRRVKVLSFRKRYGQTAALSAGFDHARGKVIITMDGDHQNDPADIPRLLEQLAEGCDVVSGWRVRRKDRWITRTLPSILANRLIGKITGTRLHDHGCALKAYKAGVTKNIHLYGEMHRFIPAVVSWLGARIVEIPVAHRPRLHGMTHYSLSRTLRVILDLINVKFLSSYLTRPLQYFGKLGAYLIIAAAGLAAAVLLVRVAGLGPLRAEIFLISALFLALMGVQLITSGLIAEIVIRTYHETQQKPIYVLKEVID